jgi:ribulose bisphosphate carboxylase small subunit
MQPQANYDFIFEDKKKPKRSLLPGGGSQTMRIILVATGALALLVIIIVFLSLLSGSSKGTTEALASLTAEQTEIVRVSGIGITKARDSEAKNLAITTELSVETSQQQIIALLKKQGHKLGTKELNLKRSASTDTQLTAAATANTFDDTFIKVMTDELTTYRTHLKSAYDASKSKNEKSILADAYNGVNQILKGLPAQSN